MKSYADKLLDELPNDSNTLYRKILIEKIDTKFIDMLNFVDILYSTIKIPKRFMNNESNK